MQEHLLIYWREDSIKTRIETQIDETARLEASNWREDSIKTRIETQACSNAVQRCWIEEKIPLKQGLKPMQHPEQGVDSGIEEKIPLKQGLKHGVASPIVSNNWYWREDSIKTRIETQIWRW